MSESLLAAPADLAARPADVPEKFWDAEAQALRVDALWTRNGLFDQWSTQASVALGVVYRIAPAR